MFLALLYHLHPPTMVTSVEVPRNARPIEGVKEHITSRRVQGFNVPSSGAALASRVLK